MNSLELRDMLMEKNRFNSDAILRDLEKSKEEIPEDYEREIDKLYKSLFLGPRFLKKIGRNAPCPCLSGKKYKKCCLERVEEIRDTDFAFKEVAVKKLLKTQPKTVEEKEGFAKELFEEWNAMSSLPSAATMLRFQRHNLEAIVNAMHELIESGEVKKMKEQVKPVIKKNSFQEKVEKTGDWKGVLLEIDKLRKERGNEWVLDVQYNILAKQFPAFELFLNEQFFKSKCKNCKRETKEETGCREGHSECLYNEEYEKFTKQYVNSIVSQLKQAKQPKELQIPKRLIEIEKRLKVVGALEKPA